MIHPNIKRSVYSTFNIKSVNYTKHLLQPISLNNLNYFLILKDSFVNFPTSFYQLFLKKVTLKSQAHLKVSVELVFPPSIICSIMKSQSYLKFLLLYFLLLILKISNLPRRHPPIMQFLTHFRIRINLILIHHFQSINQLSNFMHLRQRPL